MTWQYIAPSYSPKDAVRFLVGDTKEADPQLSDEEIAWLLDQNDDNVYDAASQAAMAVSSQYSRQADKTVGDLSIKYSQRAKAYQELAGSLSGGGSGADVGAALLAAPYAGGIRISDKANRELDADRVPPAFSRGMNDYLGRYSRDSQAQLLSPREVDLQ